MHTLCCFGIRDSKVRLRSQPGSLYTMRLLEREGLPSVSLIAHASKTLTFIALRKDRVQVELLAGLCRVEEWED